MKPVILGAHTGTTKFFNEKFIGPSWQSCFVHLMPNASDKITKNPDRLQTSKALPAVIKAKNIKEDATLYHDNQDHTNNYHTSCGAT